MEQSNLWQCIRHFSTKSFLRQAQHSRACFDTIDLDLWMDPKKFAEKTAVPLTYNQCSTGLDKFLEPINSRTLQGRAEGQRFQPIIMVRDAVEVHKSNCPMNHASGVNITKSASADRSSVSNDRK